jgi:hypothetical protein
MYTDANVVMGAESADFFFGCWYFGSLETVLFRLRKRVVLSKN